MPLRPIVASPWPEADSIFSSDPFWLGSDGAGSVIVEDKRLWLFGDTFVGSATGRKRRQAAFISNTVGVQDGPLLEAGAIEFHWKQTSAGPAPVFVQPERGSWLWPAGSFFDGSSLLVFCMETVSTRPDLSVIEAWEGQGSLGFFEVVGNVLALLDDPGAPPSSWEPRYVELEMSPNCFTGSATLEEDEWVYSFGWREGPQTRSAILSRWSSQSKFSPDLEWYSSRGWTRSAAEAGSLFNGVATEFTVHRSRDWAPLLDDATGQEDGFVHLQSGAIGSSTIEVRSAPKLWGPWSAPTTIAIPASPAGDGVFSYSARAHPGLASDGMAISFCTIGRGARQTIEDETLYYPRFLMLSPA